MEDIRVEKKAVFPGHAIVLAILAVLFALGSLASPAGPCSAAQTEQITQKPLQYEVSVTLKLIQVYVTDKSGKPVRDLTRSEFVVTDNGQPVTISAFEKHDLAEAPTSAPERPEPEPAPAAAPEESPALSRKFVILFDFAFNTMSGIKASIEAARHFIDTEVRPGDELAFVSYSMLKGLKIHEFLTTDHAKVKTALAKISTKEVAGRADEVEQQYWLQIENPALAGGVFAPRLGAATIAVQRLESMEQAGNYFRTLTRLAQALRLVQGQKSVLFFSNGIPSSLVNASRGVGTGSPISGRQESAPAGGSASAPALGSTFMVGNYELRPLQEALFREFSASNCSIYAFDTRESSKLPALFELDQMNTQAGGGTLGADGKVFRDDKTTGMDSLKSLSKQTAGKYYSNILLHEKNLAEVSSVTATYYVLGFSIPAVADGKFHEIKVEVARKGCAVRTQPGYFNPKPFKDYTNLEKDIQLFDLALNEKPELEAPKPLPITALAYDAGQGGKMRAFVRIPKEIWSPSAEGAKEIVALFFDPHDDLTSLQRIAVTKADYGGRDILFTAGASAISGTNKCRVIVRDLDTGQSAMASKTVYCPQPGSRSLSVYTPVPVVAGGGLFRLEGVVKGQTETPSWREVYPYDPVASSPVIGDEAVRGGTVEVIVPYSAPGLEPGDLTFKANFVNSGTGENLAVPVELKELTKPGTIDVQRLEISLAEVPEGKYLLYIHVGNRITGQVTSAQVPITVGGKLN
jgi:VWFA-related protein